MHDLGLIASKRTENGKEKMRLRDVRRRRPGRRSLHGEAVRLVRAAGGILPLAQAIARVFARLGEKKNRNRARIKFLVQDLGIEKFKELVLEERKILPHDPRWTDYIADELRVDGSAAAARAANLPRRLRRRSSAG